MTGINTILIMGTRQLVYEHITRTLRDKNFPPYLNLMITSAVVGFSVGLIYQPFEVILTLLAVGEKKKYGGNIMAIVKE